MNAEITRLQDQVTKGEIPFDPVAIRNDHNNFIEVKYQNKFNFEIGEGEGIYKRDANGLIEANSNNKASINKDLLKFNLKDPWEETKVLKGTDSYFITIQTVPTRIADKYQAKLLKQYPEELKDVNPNNFQEYAKGLRAGIENKIVSERVNDPKTKQKLIEELKVRRLREYFDSKGNLTLEGRNKVDSYLNYQELQYARKPDGSHYFTGKTLFNKKGNIIGTEPYWGGADSNMWSIVHPSARIDNKYDTTIKHLFGRDAFYYPKNSLIPERITRYGDMVMDENELFNHINNHREQQIKDEEIAWINDEPNRIRELNTSNKKIKSAQKQIKKGDYPTALHYRANSPRDAILDRIVKSEFENQVKRNFPGYNLDNIFLGKQPDQFGIERQFFKIPDLFMKGEGELPGLKHGGSVQDGNGEFIGPMPRPKMVDKNYNKISDYIEQPLSNFQGYSDDFYNRLWFKESEFDANANSGLAQGYAQFTPNTIKELKRLNFVNDDFDVWDAEQSKDASKKYINYLSERPWINRLREEEGKSNPEVRAAKALMAYNWGPNKLKKVLTHLKKENKGIDIYQSLDWVNKIPLKGSDKYKSYNKKIKVKKKNKKGEYIKNDKDEFIWENKTINPYSGSEENVDYVKKLLGLYDDKVQNKFEDKYNEGLLLNNIKRYGGEKGNKKIARLNEQLEKFEQGKEISGLVKKELIKLGLI